MGLRERILAAEDIAEETVEVPEWGAVVKVVGLDGADQARLMEEADDGSGGLNLRRVYPDMVILCARDPETDEPVFTEGDREALMGKASRPLNRVAMAALRVSGFLDDVVDLAGKGSSSNPS